MLFSVCKIRFGDNTRDLRKIYKRGAFKETAAPMESCSNDVDYADNSDEKREWRHPATANEVRGFSRYRKMNGRHVTDEPDRVIFIAVYECLL